MRTERQCGSRRASKMNHLCSSSPTFRRNAPISPLAPSAASSNFPSTPVRIAASTISPRRLDTQYCLTPCNDRTCTSTQSSNALFAPKQPPRMLYIGYSLFKKKVTLRCNLFRNHIVRGADKTTIYTHNNNVLYILLWQCNSSDIQEIPLQYT